MAERSLPIPVKVDDDVVAKFESLSDLAPLHNPAGLIGYRAFKEALPDCVHTFVFDTALPFHDGAGNVYVCAAL